MNGKQYNALKRLFTGEDNFVEEAFTEMDCANDSTEAEDIQLINDFIEETEKKFPDGIEDDENVSICSDEEE